jgi:hypothetical protein
MKTPVRVKNQAPGYTMIDPARRLESTAYGTEKGIDAHKKGPFG